jgi:hypothetical protein
VGLAPRRQRPIASLASRQSKTGFRQPVLQPVDHRIYTTGSQATAELATDLSTAVTLEERQVEDIQIADRSLTHSFPTALQEESPPLSVQHPFLWRGVEIDRAIGRVSLEAHQSVNQAPTASFQSRAGSKVVDNDSLTDTTEIGPDLGFSPGTTPPEAERLLVKQAIIGVLDEVLTLLTAQSDAESTHRPIDSSGQPIFETPHELSPRIWLE